MGSKGVGRVPTGIKGFDEVLNGGLPSGRMVVVKGSPGTGKTVLLNEFLYRGIKEHDENGVFVTFEERPEDIMKNVESFGWNYEKLVKGNKLCFVDVSPDTKNFRSASAKGYSLEPILERVKHAIKKVDADRISIDSISTLFNRFPDREKVREIIFLIKEELKNVGVTCLVSSEDKKEGFLSEYGGEDFVADGVIELGLESGEQGLVRKLLVRKMRGAGYRSGEVEFVISDRGMEIFPKIPFSNRVAKTDFTARKKFSISRLNRALGGGIPKGHIVLISGNTGTGKTLFCLDFLTKGLGSGEPAVFVALEEPVEQIKTWAKMHGWDLGKYEDGGDLRFVTADLIDTNQNKLLYDIVEAVNQSNAERIVFDSMSSLLSATMDKDKVREFLIQLVGFLKKKGVTCILTYLSSDVFRAEEGKFLGSLKTTKIRLSSITDGIIILRYAEKEGEVRRLMNVLKLRGSDHDKCIFDYTIEKGGISIDDSSGLQE